MTIDKIMPSQQVTWSQDYRLWIKLTRRWSSAVEWPRGALFQYDNGLFTPQMWTRQNSFVWSPIVFTPPTEQFCHVSTQFWWVLSCLRRWCEHNWRRDKTVLSSRVGGVNTIGDATKLSCLVKLAVWTQLHTRQDSFVWSPIVFTPPTRTRQNSFVSSASAVWTSHLKPSKKFHCLRSNTVKLPATKIHDLSLTYTQFCTHWPRYSAELMEH